MTTPRFDSLRKALVFPLAMFALCPAASRAEPALSSGSASAATPKRPVLTADDLPRHTYPMTEAPSKLIEDPAAFATLAAAVKRDLEKDLEECDIKDRTTLESFKGTLLALAILDRNSAEVRKLVAEMRSLEEKPSLKLTTGLFSEAWANAVDKAVPPDRFASTFESEFSALVQKLPWNLVQNDLKQLKGGFEIRSRNLFIGLIQKEIDPAALKTGSISADVARNLVGIRNALATQLPLKDEVVRVLRGTVAAHSASKPDRWTARLIELSPKDPTATPVVVGIWDSGVDADDFKDQMYTDSEGRHGIAFNLHSEPTPEPLMPLGEAESRLPELVSRLKGFIDLRSNIDSPEAGDVRLYMQALKPEQVTPTLEGLSLVSGWAHGSHVAGISVAGNPFARIVSCRITFDTHLVPETPTIEQAQRDVTSYRTAVDYFKKAGVRVVNMSWGGSLKDVESDLEKNGAGGTVEERKKLARSIFDIDTTGLLAALKSAPEILFVVAAGNGDDNVAFDEFIPSSFQIPNMITVGAVDQAGEETSFSSFGPMVNVHANGYEVESWIPGGKRLKFSGTSMAAPQVTNLAAKLFSLAPKLGPGDAKELIVAGCDRQGRVNLINPAKSVALLKQRQGIASIGK